MADLQFALDATILFKPSQLLEATSAYFRRLQDDLQCYAVLLVGLDEKRDVMKRQTGCIASNFVITKALTCPFARAFNAHFEEMEIKHFASSSSVELYEVVGENDKHPIADVTFAGAPVLIVGFLGKTICWYRARVLTLGMCSGILDRSLPQCYEGAPIFSEQGKLVGMIQSISSTKSTFTTASEIRTCFYSSLDILPVMVEQAEEEDTNFPVMSGSVKPSSSELPPQDNPVSSSTN